MQRPPQFSRRYPWLTLALAIPLVAVLAFIAYQRYVEEDAGDGWKTYRNARFGYEIRLPPSWEVERVDSPGDLKPGLPTQMTTFVQRGVRDDPIPRSSDQPPPQVAPRASVWVNPQGDWCTGNTYSDKRTISVDGVPGDERVCYTYGLLKETCQPRPRCFDQPWGILRSFEYEGNHFWISANTNPIVDDDVEARFEIAKQIVQSFRFVD